MVRLWLLLISMSIGSLGFAQTRPDSTTSAGLPNQLVMRMGYTSQVVYAGRTLGTQQFGLSPSLAYYHQSGFFGSLAGGYYSGDEPRYALTTFSAGYAKDITDKLSATLTCDHL